MTSLLLLYQAKKWVGRGTPFNYLPEYKDVVMTNTNNVIEVKKDIDIAG